jgi:trans-aconitate 2-methyltransferase
MATWDPGGYLRFADERGRPFMDLTGRVRAANPRTVVDLGCGPGNLTACLARRWPGAAVTGVDSSESMIAAAPQGANVRFEVADLSRWQPADAVDVLVANAVLQWVPGHLEQLPRLVDWLAPAGWFALQVPGNFDQPSHVLLRRLADDARFREHTAGLTWPSAHGADTYLDVLGRQGLVVDAWETTYLHVLTGPDPVLRWISGTGARPVLQALPPDLRATFETEYAAALREAYPDRGGHVVMPFRRVFAVAHEEES